MSTGEKFLQIKTSVNTRMPLDQRTQPVQQGPPPTTGSDGNALFPRRHPVKSTYNDSFRHYEVAPGSTLGGSGAGQSASGGQFPRIPSTSNDHSNATNKAPSSFPVNNQFNGSQGAGLQGGPMSPVSFDAAAKAQGSFQGLDAAAEGFAVEPSNNNSGNNSKPGAYGNQQGGGKPYSPNQSGRGGRGPVMVSTQRAEYTGAGAVSGPDALDAHLSFYSHVRKQEALDDKARSGVSDLQRTVEVSAKRQTDASFLPPTFDMDTCARNMRAARSGGSSTVAGGGAASPVSPTSGKTVRSQSIDVAGRALPLCLTANGQVRHGTRTMPIDVSTNVCCTLLTKPTTQQKEFELPPPRIAEDISAEYIVQRRAITDGASGLDLFQGTAKASPLVIPLFMGHVPGSERNLAKRQPEGEDILRSHAKRFINIAVPAHLEAAGSAGRTAAERSSSSISQTVMGFYSEQAARASNEELRLNVRVPKPF